MLLLQKQEFNEAIVEIHIKSAQGQGDITPTFLKALGPRARLKLLEPLPGFSSWRSPQIWKVAIILPFKKAGKPPGCIYSFRPISLTRSCVSRSGLVTDTRPLNRKRLSLSSLISLRHSLLSREKTCCSEQSKKAFADSATKE